MDKPQLYIICVTIIEGRQFAIANMDSVVHVRIGEQKKNTNVKHSTESPYFNEVIYYLKMFHTDQTNYLHFPVLCI